MNAYAACVKGSDDLGAEASSARIASATAAAVSAPGLAENCIRRGLERTEAGLKAWGDSGVGEPKSRWSAAKACCAVWVGPRDALGLEVEDAGGTGEGERRRGEVLLPGVVAGGTTSRYGFVRAE